MKTEIVKHSAFNKLYIISFIEGAALMAIELLGAKMIAPFYGNSLYVWTAVLATTLGGLTLGYFFGGQLSARFSNRKILNIVIALSVLVVGLLPFTGTAIMNATLDLELRLGITISAFVILTPPLLLFGMVSPLIINMLSADPTKAGSFAGIVYAVSTFGGILATFFMGFYLIPFVGIKASTFGTAIALGIPLLFFFFDRKK
jgi:MFS family permease